jgi:glycosyltransferase involved in cell wall biosynthesis
MLAPQPFFEPRGTPFSVLGRLKALSELGHQVDLLTYHRGENVSIPNVVIHRTPPIGFIKGVRIGPSATKLLLDILVLIKAFGLLRRGNYDLLHTHEEASFFGVLLARAFRIPHLYDMHSSLPQQLKNFHYTNFRPLIRLFEWLEYWAIGASNAVITICPALEEHVSRINGHVPHVLIENTASEENSTTSAEEIPRKAEGAHSLNGKKIILYTGTLEPYQGIDLLIASAERVIRQRSDVMFLLLGGTPAQVDHYRSRIEQLGFSAYFHFAGVRPPQEIPQVMQHSHVLVSPRTNGTNTPLKIYAYLRSGKPIVATNLYTHTQVLDSNVAVLVEANPSALAQGILSVLGDPTLSNRLGEQAQRLYNDKYSFENFIQKTEQILQLATR